MALKDLFSNFFMIEEEEEVAEKQPEQSRNQTEPDPEPKQEQYTSQAPQQQTPQKQNNYYNERQRAIKTVPKRQTQGKRLQSSQNEGKFQTMNETARNVVNMNASNFHESSKMCLFEPRVFSDTQDIADELKNRRATLVNLQRIDKVSAKRIIDFLSGTVYAIGGDIQRVGHDIFLCTPDNVEVAGSITEDMETSEYDYE